MRFYLTTKSHKVLHKVSQRKNLIFMNIEKKILTVLDCSFQVHTALGSGLLESVYEESLYYELLQSGLNS